MSTTIKHVVVNEVTYDIEDADARGRVAELESNSSIIFSATEPTTQKVHDIWNQEYK